MKQSSALFLAASMLLTGTAFEASANKTEIRNEFIPKVEMQSLNFALKAFKPEKKSRPRVNPVERNESSADGKMLEGTWTFVIGDNYFSGARGFVAVEFTATVDDNNQVTFKSVNNDYHPIMARYNPKTHSISFYKKYLVQDGDNYIFQEPFVYNWEKGSLEKRSITAYYNEFEEAIVFNDNMGIAWSAYQEKGGKTHKGYYDILDLTISYLPISGDWLDIGNGLFTDGWLLPAFDNKDLNNTYEVPVQQNTENQNLYRLVNPYKYGPLASTNESTKDGYIIFDISDPEHVVFRLADAGYVNNERGCSMFFAYNCMGSLVLINPFYTPEEVILEFGEEFPKTTYKAGKIEFDYSMAAPDIRFAVDNLANSTRYWESAPGVPVKSQAGILLPGAAGIEIMGAPEEGTEFFNLQGIRLQNPEPGQIVLKRKGNTISKEIMK